MRPRRRTLGALQRLHSYLWLSFISLSIYLFLHLTLPFLLRDPDRKKKRNHLPSVILQNLNAPPQLSSPANDLSCLHRPKYKKKNTTKTREGGSKGEGGEGEMHSPGSFFFIINSRTSGYLQRPGP